MTTEILAWRVDDPEDATYAPDWMCPACGIEEQDGEWFEGFRFIAISDRRDLPTAEARRCDGPFCEGGLVPGRDE